MAIDEAIAVAHGRGEVPPTLRFYGWNPPAVSIGYFQSMLEEVDLDAVRAGGYGYVRRPTGGRLIFHHMELTYSVVIREELLPGGVVETYREISQGLLAGMAELGAPAELSGGDRDPRRADPDGFHTACFDTASAYELQIGGRKVAGSAQTRRDGVILQHGSILLDIDVPLLFRLMRLPGGRFGGAAHGPVPVQVDHPRRGAGAAGELGGGPGRLHRRLCPRAGADADPGAADRGRGKRGAGRLSEPSTDVIIGT